MKKNTLFLLLALLCASQISAQWMPLDSSRLVVSPRYDVHYVDTILDLGNGIGMRTQMCLPVTNAPIPVVVLRCPYFPEQMSISQLPAFRQYAERGIGYVMQHCRGTGGSAGVFEPNINERQDGLRLLRWLNGQPWVEAIGLTGTSYMGLTCWIVADSLPDKVKAIHLHHYGVDRHLSAYNSGLFRQDILTAWSIDCAKEPIRRPHKDPAAPYYTEERYMPQINMDVDLLGHALPWYRDWISHTDYTDPYWHQGVWDTLRSIPAKIKVPVTVVAGHYDHHNEGTLLGYNLLSPETKAMSRLIVGSWNHSFVTTPTIHQPRHDRDVNIDADAFCWLYSLLVAKEEPRHEVLIYAVGEDRWHSVDEWPLSADTYQRFYLPAKGEVARQTPPRERKASRSFVYDPKDPVISIGGATLFTSEQTRGSVLQPVMGYRPDVLSFTTEVLTEDCLIDGCIRAVIYMSSDADDTALTIKVSELFPDGSAYNIRSGITTLAYRNNRLGARQTYTPGQVVELTIETLPVLWQVKAGHRLRIDISSSNFPEYAIHSNYAGVWSLQTQTRPAIQTLYMDKTHPSRIEIPLSNHR